MNKVKLKNNINEVEVVQRQLCVPGAAKFESTKFEHFDLPSSFLILQREYAANLG
jgi:hypothetical protein